jgi:hypothetical protein
MVARLRSALSAVAAGVVVSNSMVAQEKARSVVAVTVLETGSQTPLSDVTLRFRGVEQTLRTDSSGTVHFRDVPAGARAIQGRRLGYSVATAMVTVGGADTTEVVLFMRAAVARLPGVEITDKAMPATLREFEQRRRRGTGRYLTEAQIDDAFGSNLNSILARLRLRSDDRVYSRRGCVTVYLNGMHLRNDDVSDIDPIQLAGVEYYDLGFIPVQYPARTSCHGVLLFWSKVQ